MEAIIIFDTWVWNLKSAREEHNYRPQQDKIYSLSILLFTQHFYHCQEEHYKSLPDHSSYVPQIVVYFPEPPLIALCWTVRPECDIKTRPISFRALLFILLNLCGCAGCQIYGWVLQPPSKAPWIFKQNNILCGSCTTQGNSQEVLLPCLILPTSESTQYTTCSVVLSQEDPKVGWDQEYVLP